MYDQWPHVLSTIALLRAADSFGIQRALGAAFFGCWNGTIAGQSPTQSREATAGWFVEQGGSGGALLRTVENIDPDSWRRLYVERYNGSELEYNLTTLTSRVIAGGIRWNADDCSVDDYDVDERNELVNQWQVFRR